MAGSGADEHWAAVCRATQARAGWQAERRWSRRHGRRRGVRLRIAVLLVRAGLRVASPLTVEHLLDAG